MDAEVHLKVAKLMHGLLRVGKALLTRGGGQATMYKRANAGADSRRHAHIDRRVQFALGTDCALGNGGSCSAGAGLRGKLYEINCSRRGREMVARAGSSPCKRGSNRSVVGTLDRGNNERTLVILRQSEYRANARSQNSNGPNKVTGHHLPPFHNEVAWALAR